MSRGSEDMGAWRGNLTFDYDPAGQDIIGRAAAIKAVGDRRGVPLRAAAVQFPLHHPMIPSVAIGARTPEQARANSKLLRTPIPNDLWAELKQEGLLPAEALTPI